MQSTLEVISRADAEAVARFVAGQVNTLDVSAMQTPLARQLARWFRTTGDSDRAEALRVWLAMVDPAEADAIRDALLAVDPVGVDLPPRPSATVADLDAHLAEIRWEWESWIAKGVITIVAGQPGVGKSYFVLWLVACILLGKRWPDGTDSEGEPGVVVWADTESSQALLRTRVTQMGIPADKVLLPSTDPENPLADFRLDTPEGWGELERVVATNKPRLVVVDSLRGAHARDENDSQLQLLLKKLAALARDHDTAVIVVHHLRKSSQFEREKEVTLDRVRGSSAIVAMARTVIAVDAPDPSDPERLRLSVIKSNLTERPSPLGFTIGASGLSFGSPPEPPRRETQADRAVEFLRVMLTQGPVLVGELLEAAKAVPLSQRTLERAKMQLGLVSVKCNSGWAWSLPSSSAPPEAQAADSARAKMRVVA